MQHEETSFIYDVKYLPAEVMSDDEYRRRRDEAVQDMTGRRLGRTDGFRVNKTLNRHELGAGIPSHRSEDVMRRQFERFAADHFTGQFDERCNTCKFCQLDINASQDIASNSLMLTATCYCKGRKMQGVACFDGYVPSMDKWRWDGEEMPVHASFQVRENMKGDRLATLNIVHDNPMARPYDDPMTMTRHFGDNMRDEPPGFMTRNNADSGYLTREELKLANEALARTAKEYRATQPTPQPATPMDDAW